MTVTGLGDQTFAAIAELGFRAAEIRALQAQLAAACARQDTDLLLDLAEELLSLHARFAEAYRKLLIIGPHRTAASAGSCDALSRSSSCAAGEPAVFNQTADH